MNTAKQTTCVFLLFVVLTGICSTYVFKEDSPPCEKDKCFVAIHSDEPRVHLCWMQDDNQIVEYMNPMDGGAHVIPNACRRSNIFGGDGYLVAYPSIGGVVLLRNPSAVDLQYLGLPNTHDTVRLPDEVDDDDLATRMVQLGAQWWPNWDLYFRHSHRVDEGIVFYDYHFPSKVDVAYPATGGVWVVNSTRDTLRYRYGCGDKVCPSWLPYLPNTCRGKLQYALTMDDKAEMLEDMGGMFYGSVDDVIGLEKTLREAVSLFEPFRERLSNMDDNGYRSQFYEDGYRGRLYEDEARDTAYDKPGKPRWGIGSLFSILD